MTINSSRGYLPLFLAGLCLVGGVTLGIMMNRSAVDGNGYSLSGGANSKEARELEALQQELAATLVLPVDFKQVPEFSLLDVDAQPIDRSVFEDKWSIAFFGFTHCPDVCPITLTVMKEVVEQLASADVPQPQTIFVSVDPKRDTPDVLKRYIGYFNEEFVGITGDLNGVLQLTKALGIVSAFTVREDNPDEYDVDHTASMLLIDPQGRMRAKLTAPHTASNIVADYIKVLNALHPTQTAGLE